MRIAKVTVFLLLVLSGLGTNVKAQGEAAVPYLLLAPDSRFSGIGESGSGLSDNSAAIWWNPAGIAFLSGQEFSFTHSEWLPQFDLDLFYDYATYRNYIDAIDGSVLASITYMNYGEFIRTGATGPEEIGRFTSFDMAVTAGYTTKLHPDWGLGFNFRLIHSQLSDQPTGEEQGKGIATSVSFDIAGMWRPGELKLPFVDYDMGNKLSIGVNISNLGPKIAYIDQDQADPIPTNFRLGLAYRLYADDYNALTYTLDFSKLLVTKHEDGTSDEFYEAIFTSWFDEPADEEFADIVSSMGIEYWYGEPGDFLFAIRSGYFYEDPQHGGRKFITFGAGLRYEIYGFDFSYISTSMFKNQEDHPLSDTLRFTILVGWGGVIESLASLPRGI